jgi:hypothetical protein
VGAVVNWVGIQSNAAQPQEEEVAEKEPASATPA